MTKPVRCHVCKQPAKAIRVGTTERFVVLPHSPTGGPRRFGETCGKKR